MFLRNLVAAVAYKRNIELIGNGIQFTNYYLRVLPSDPSLTDLRAS